MGLTAFYVVGAASAYSAGKFVSDRAFGGEKHAIAPKVKPMPDQLALDDAAQKKAALDAARQSGRASTILSSGTDTGDRLGP